MPGHKRRLPSGEAPYDIDITEIDGFDNLHHAEGIILEAEERAAKLYGSEETHYLINGSTCGILAAIGAAVPFGGRILMARNSHKAAYHAACLNHLSVTYLYPRRPGTGDLTVGLAGQDRGDVFFADPIGQKDAAGFFTDRNEQTSAEGAGNILDVAEGFPADFNGRISAEDVGRALSADTAGEIRAVFLTSPTYEGVVSDVRTIAEIAHKREIPLIVDEAHGAHFGMHEMFPESSVKKGADLVIHSLHKTMPSMTQTSLIHVNGPLVDRRRLRRMLDIYQTSSPNYVLMASMDRCISLISEQGDALFEAFAGRLRRFYSSCADLRFFRLLKTDDPSKILVMPNPRLMSAVELYDTFRDRYHLQPEMCALSYVLMLSSVGDSNEGFERLSCAMHEMDGELGQRQEEGQPASPAESGNGQPATAGEDQAGFEGFPPLPRSEEVTKIAEAMDGESEEVAFEKSAGRVSCEFLYLYPPGIPMIAPGERITEELISRVREVQAMGFEINGAEDRTMQKIRVLH